MKTDASNSSNGRDMLPDWAQGMYDAVDNNDLDRFMSFLAPGIGFGFDGQVMARGTSDVRAFVETYLGGFDRLIHYFEGVVTVGDTTFIRGRVDYIIADKGKTNAGWAVCIRRAADKVDEYLIYMDPMPLLRLQGHLPE